MINNQSRTGQAFWLAIGNLVSFSFGIISSAILSRLFSVEEYGTYRQVMYVYSTLLTVFTLGLPRAYSFFLPRLPQEQGKDTVHRINVVFLALGFLFSCLLFFGAEIIGSILKNPELPTCLRYFSLTPMFLLPVMGIESIMATYKQSAFATIYIILSRIFTLVFVVAPVLLFSCGPNGAVIGFTIASALCCAVGLYLERKPFKGIYCEKSQLSLKEVLKYSFPLLIASLWGILINSAPQFFISRWYGTESFAEFANGFIELPFAGMIIGAVTTVLLPEISRLSDKNDISQISDIWRSSFEKSAKIIYPLAIFACIFAYPIIEVLYGNKYISAANYFQIILIVNLIRVVPYAPIMMGLDMGKQYAYASCISAIFVVFLDTIWVNFFNSPYGVAYIQCFGIFLQVVMLFFYLSKTITTSIFQLIPYDFCLKIIIISVVSSIASLWLSNFIPILIIKLITGGIIFSVIYILLCSYLNISYKSLITPLIKKVNKFE